MMEILLNDISEIFEEKKNWLKRQVGITENYSEFSGNYENEFLFIFSKFKVGCVHSIVILSEFRIGQQREYHRRDAPHFTNDKRKVHLRGLTFLCITRVIYEPWKHTLDNGGK